MAHTFTAFHGVYGVNSVAKVQKYIEMCKDYGIFSYLCSENINRTQMKQFLLVLVAMVALCACNSGEQKSLAYRGLPMDLPFQAFCDSLASRGYAVDSAKTDSAFTRVVMARPGDRYRLMLAQQNGRLQALQENYTLTTNDSTRRTWQQLRDDFEKELGSWPNMPKHGDDHKIAKFETEGGFITLTLKNTYRPTLSVLYELK